MNGEWMAREMAEQPEVLDRLLAHWDEDAAALAAVLPANLAGVTFIARGSSSNAGRLGALAAELYSGLPSSDASPSLVTRYGSAPHRDRLIVALSQSGRTPEIVDAAARLRGEGSVLLAISNDPESPLARLGDLHLPVAAGAELAVPATKTVTAQVVRVLLVAAVLAERVTGAAPWTAAERAAAVDAVRAVLADPARAEVPAALIAGATRLQVVGRGILQPIVDESALKIRESAGVFSQGISAFDLVHGPIAAVDGEVPVWVVDADGPTARELGELVQRLRGMGSPLITTGPSRGDLPIPAGLREEWAALPLLVRAQQVAHRTALLRGLDPDAPAGLAKVTLVS